MIWELALLTWGMLKRESRASSPDRKNYLTRRDEDDGYWVYD